MMPAEPTDLKDESREIIECEREVTGLQQGEMETHLIAARAWLEICVRKIDLFQAERAVHIFL